MPQNFKYDSLFSQNSFQWCEWLMNDDITASKKYAWNIPCCCQKVTNLVLIYFQRVLGYFFPPIKYDNHGCGTFGDNPNRKFSFADLDSLEPDGRLIIILDKNRAVKERKTFGQFFKLTFFFFLRIVCNLPCLNLKVANYQVLHLFWPCLSLSKIW